MCAGGKLDEVSWSTNFPGASQQNGVAAFSSTAEGNDNIYADNHFRWGVRYRFSLGAT